MWSRLGTRFTRLACWIFSHSESELLDARPLDFLEFPTTLSREGEYRPA
jgi:hypothetical protein